MQPIVKAGFLCDYAITSEDGKLSIMGIFSNINFPNLPNAYSRFFVVLIVTLDAGVYPVRLGIVDPSGQQMLPEPPTIEVRAEVAGNDTNLVVDFNNLVFQRAGIHQIQLFINDRLTHSIPVAIQSLNAPGLLGAQA